MPNQPRACQPDKCSRRTFLGSCGAAAVGIGALSMFPSWSGGILSAAETDAGKKSRIRLVFAYPDPSKPIWPNIGYDFDGHIREVTQKLAAGCPSVEFLPVTISDGNADAAKKIVTGDGNNVDGYLVYMAGCLWGETPETIAAAGKPTVIADNLFAGSGKFLVGSAAARRAGRRVVAVSSSNFQDTVDAVNCIHAIGALSRSKVLVVGSEPSRIAIQTYGTGIQSVGYPEVNEFYRKVDRKEAQAVADRWIKTAGKVIEPKRETIVDSAAMYLTMDGLLVTRGADAIAVNCLSGIYAGEMVEAYPCLGFMALDDSGKVGACEADQRSTITKLLMKYLAGRPGFISDPVIDTATNRIIYAHCVAPTRVFGPEGPANPFHIRDHSEDRKGACNRSLMPLGETVTTIMFDAEKKKVIMHQGVTVENVDEDKACRTKLAVEVKGDIHKLLEQWDEWGWHRVTFYGDHRRKVIDTAALLGFGVVEEA